MVDVQEEKGAYEVPMRDHVSRFYKLLRDEYVHISVDIRRTMGDGTTYFDGSSFSNDVAKAISDAVAEREAEPVAVVVGHHVVQGPNVEFLTDNLNVGTRLYVSPPTSELEALRKRVAELEMALIECEEYFDNLADADHDGIGFVANEEMKLQMMICRVREGGKVDG